MRQAEIKFDRIAKSIAAAWLKGGEWAVDPKFDCSYSESDFFSELFDVKAENGRIVFTPKSTDGDFIYQFVSGNLDESKFMTEVVNKAYNTFNSVLGNVVSPKMNLAEPFEVVELFSDKVLDLSRVDAFYDRIYREDGRKDLTKEDYDAEAEEVKAAIQLVEDKLESTQDIDFKVELKFETEVDEDNLLEEENGRKLYSECGCTATAYGILDGKTKKLWSVYRLIDSEKSQRAFNSLLDEKLEKWFDIRLG